MTAKTKPETKNETPSVNDKIVEQLAAIAQAIRAQNDIIRSLVDALRKL